MSEPNEHLKALFQHAASWRYYARSMYNFSMTQMLEWPSLTCDWIPDKKMVQSDRDYTLQYLAVGTQALPGSQNYINIVEVAIPMESDDIDEYYGGLEAVEKSKEKGNKYAEIRGHSRVDQLLMVEAQVLKLRAMPQASNLLAVKMTNGYVSIFDIEKRPKFSDDVAAMVPDVKLRGHRKAGFGLAWNPSTLGFIASGGDDQLVCYWDIDAVSDPEENGGNASGDVRPLHSFSGHSDAVHEVAWHSSQDHLLGSVSEDKSFRLWDTRTNHVAQVVEDAHRGGVYGVDFHPVASYQFATCGADRIVKLWDLRKLNIPAHQLIYHSNEVTSVKWSPFSDTVIASSGQDRRVVMWDLQKIGTDEQAAKVAAKSSGNSSDDENIAADEELAPPELSFVHTGHLSRVLDMAWNPGLEDEWLMASVDMTNSLQLFKPSRDIVYDFVEPDVFDLDNGEA